MKIVVLDGYTLNPGDLSWDGLSALGETVIYDRTPDALRVERAKDAPIILTNKTVLNADILVQLPLLRYIGVLATGYNVVDIDAARERGIPVTNIPIYGTRSVAQMVFAHILNFVQSVAHHAQTVREGRWTANADFCYWDMPLTELDGLTMGLIGYGRIGQATAQLACAFGMKVLAFDLYPPANVPEGVSFASLDDVFRNSDIISLHCPLTAENRHLVNAERLRTMKSSAFLVNTSRGPLIDEQALADALNQGLIAGAGLDVLAVEPPKEDNPLLTARNCHITPHIAWATRAARSRLMDMAVANVKAFQENAPMNVINGVA